MKSTILLRVGAVAALFLLLSSLSVMSAEGQPAEFLTGLRMPSAEEKALLEKTAVRLSAPTKSADELPSSVKNIEFLPVVGRQMLPNCGAFAPTYYMKTYQEARKRGWGRPNTPDRIMSPGIAYAFGQSDVSGAYMGGTIQIMCQVGILPLSLLPDTYLYDLTRFPSAKLFLEAMPYRSGEMVVFDSKSEEGLLAIKEWLAKGELAVFGIGISQATFDYGRKLNVPDVNNEVIYGLGGDLFDWHALTLIGYDDNKTYHDGTEEKRGAFYGINSWGGTWGVEDPDIGTGGFFWLSYDYFRGNAYSDAYSMTMRDNPVPKWVGLFEYEHPHAHQAAISFRGGSWNNSEWSASWPPGYPSIDTGYQRFYPLAVDFTGDGQDSSEIFWWGVANYGAIPGIPHPKRDGRAYSFRVFKYEDAVDAHAGSLFYPGLNKIWRDIQLDDINAPSIDAEGLPIDVTGTLLNMIYIPAGIFDAGEEILSPPLIGDMVLADLNKSGLPDIIAIGNTTQVYENLGGTFRRVDSHGLPNAGNAAVAVGDFNRDGFPDVAICGTSEGEAFTSIYRNLGNFRFRDIEAGLPGVAGYPLTKASLAWGDYDNDGLEDLAFWGEFVEPNFSRTRRTRVFRNQGKGVFEPAPFQLPERLGGKVAWHDVNGDGMLDLCAGSHVFINQGNGLVSSTPVGFADDGVWADFSGDGMPELVRLLTSPSRQAAFYRYTEGGSLEYAGVALPGVRFPVLAADYNNSGRMDLISGGADSGSKRVTAFYRQLANGGFTNSGIELGAAMEGAVAMADLDGTGALDMMITGYTSMDISPWPLDSRLHRNRLRSGPLGMPINTRPEPPVNLRVEKRSGSGEFVFLWDHGTDTQTPRSALAYNVRIGSWHGGNNIVSPASCAPVTPVFRYYRIAPDQPGLILRNLSSGHFYWSARTVDGGGLASEWAPEQYYANLDGYILEDINGNGVFDVADVVQFSEMVQEYRDELPLCYDYNEDGKICQADVRTLAKKILSSEEFFPGEYTIGPEGGSISLDGLELNVPPGAFAEPAVLTVERTDAKGAYGREEAPELYRITGLPVVTNGPYSITLVPYESVPEMPLVLLGEETFAFGGGGAADVRYRFEEPEILPDGRYRIEAPVLEGEERETASLDAVQKYSIDVGIFKWGYIRRVSGTYFRIYHANHIEADDVVDLNHYGFYAALTKLRDTYGFSYAKRTRWPIDVYLLKPDRPDEDGALVTSFWGANSNYIEINEALMGNWTRRNLTASHEFFHLVQGLYDPASSREQASREKYPRWWLDEAMSTWAEELVVPSNYVPSNYIGNIEQPFILTSDNGGVAYGLNASGKDAEQHGYGMAPLVKYLASRRKESLLDFYQSIKNGSDPVWALRHAMPEEDIGDWYNDYFHQLVEGKLYPYKTPFETMMGIVRAGRTLRLEPTSGDPVSWKSFVPSPPDLAAAPYLLTFASDYPDPPADSVFVVRYKGDPPIGLQMFRLFRGDQEQAQRVAFSLGDGETKFEVIPNAQDFKKTSSGLLTLVTNTSAQSPYTQARAGVLSFGLAKPGPFPLPSSTTRGLIDQYQFPSFVSQGTLEADYISDFVQTPGTGLSFPMFRATVWGSDTVDIGLEYQADIEELSETFVRDNKTITISTQGIDTYRLIKSDRSGAIIETQTDDTGTFNFVLDSTDRTNFVASYQVRGVYSVLYEEEGAPARKLDLEWPLAAFVFFIP